MLSIQSSSRGCFCCHHQWDSSSPFHAIHLSIAGDFINAVLTDPNRSWPLNNKLNVDKYLLKIRLITAQSPVSWSFIWIRLRRGENYKMRWSTGDSKWWLLNNYRIGTNSVYTTVQITCRFFIIPKKKIFYLRELRCSVGWSSAT